ncbi:MAG: serpin family protein [Bacteroides sp.]|nr:serpin family protein [Bacteroides sp.]
MNKILLTGVAAIAAVFLPACSSDDSTKNNQLNPIELSRAESEVSANLNGFSVNLLQALVDQNDENKNIAVSPLGAGMVAGLFGNAIADEDLSELTKALGLESNDLTALNSFNAKMLETLPSHDKSATLKLANGSWFDQDYVQLSDPYRSMLEDTYKSEIHMADFRNSATLADINSWVSERTDNAIPNILNKLDKDNYAVWLSTLYFKGVWKSRFIKSKTKKDNFTLADGTTTEVDMMKGAEKVAALLIRWPVEGYDGPLWRPDADSDDIYQTAAVTLDYGNSAFALTAIMPDERIKIKDFIAENHDKLADAIVNPKILGEHSDYTADVIFPKLNLTVKTDLAEPMKALGANNIFTGVNMPGIGIALDRSMTVKDFMQNICLDIDEDGAVVKVATVASGMPTANVSPIAKFDHPFIYFIWEKTTGTILLEGVVMNPNE